MTTFAVAAVWLASNASIDEFLGPNWATKYPVDKYLGPWIPRVHNVRQRLVAIVRRLGPGQSGRRHWGMVARRQFGLA